MRHTHRYGNSLKASKGARAVDVLIEGRGATEKYLLQKHATAAAVSRGSWCWLTFGVMDLSNGRNREIKPHPTLHLPPCLPSVCHSKTGCCRGGWLVPSAVDSGGPGPFGPPPSSEAPIQPSSCPSTLAALLLLLKHPPMTRMG